MIFSTVFNYLIGLLIEKFRSCKSIARLTFLSSIFVNLGILCFFKYYGFIISNINNAFSLSIPILNLPLPIGISFYTFQTMSYIIDVYLGKVAVQKNFIAFGTYISMFPQLIAGPIVKYGDIAQQLTKRRESIDKFGSGVEIFITGLAKKVLIANNIGLLWNSVKMTPLGEISVLSSWLGILAFTLQIYYDFCGYSDMAVGLGRMFGFELMKNFNYPYISKSVTEFWRRWHISLGSWFREYVYIPLGGNRKGRAKQYRNLFIVWFLTGFWHGANWNFILWGLYFGFFVTLEKIFLGKWLNNRPAILGWAYTFFIVVLGWVFFEGENLNEGLYFLKIMFGLTGAKLIDSQALYYFYTNIFLFIVAAIGATPLLGNMVQSLRQKNKLSFKLGMPLIGLLLLLLSTAYLVNESYNPFLYFRF